MELILSKKAIKFLKKLSPKEQERIQEKLAILLDSVEESGLVPAGELDIKTLEGEWKGFLRMRIGKIRVVFTIDPEQEELRVYDMGFRGDIYKSSGIAYQEVLTISPSSLYL